VQTYRNLIKFLKNRLKYNLYFKKVNDLLLQNKTEKHELFKINNAIIILIILLIAT
jgi:hypothetical protein